MSNENNPEQDKTTTAIVPVNTETVSEASDNDDKDTETPEKIQNDNVVKVKDVRDVVNLINTDILPRIEQLEGMRGSFNKRFDELDVRMQDLEIKIPTQMREISEEMFKKYMPERRPSNDGVFSMVTSFKDLIDKDGKLDLSKMKMLKLSKEDFAEFKEMSETIGVVVKNLTEAGKELMKALNGAFGGQQASVSSGDSSLGAVYDYVFKQAAEKEMVDTIKRLERHYGIKIPKELLAGALETAVESTQKVLSHRLAT